MISLCSTFSGLIEGPESLEFCALFPILGCAVCNQAFAFLLGKSRRKEKKKRQSKPTSFRNLNICLLATCCLYSIREWIKIIKIHKNHHPFLGLLWKQKFWGNGQQDVEKHALWARTSRRQTAAHGDVDVRIPVLDILMKPEIISLESKTGLKPHFSACGGRT